MKIGEAKKRPAGIIDMVPMINFAFLLLIFVMLVGAIAAPDMIPVHPPKSTAPTVQDSLPDTVIIDASGKIGFEGQIVEPDALLLRAQRWQKTAGDRPLIVKADANTEAQRVVTILEVLRAAGVVRASLLTTKRSE